MASRYKVISRDDKTDATWQGNAKDVENAVHKAEVPATHTDVRVYKQKTDWVRQEYTHKKR